MMSDDVGCHVFLKLACPKLKPNIVFSRLEESAIGRAA